MGRKKIPTDTKRQRGTYQPVRDLKLSADGNIEIVPDPPDTLNDAGKATWYRVCHYLVEKQRLRAVHLPQVERYCTWCEVYTACMDEIRTDGAVTIYNNDNPGVSAWMKAAKEAIGQMTQFERVFGLTPLADAGLPQPAPAVDDDPWTLQ